MDKRQKSALRSQHIKIADELILDEDFYAALRRDKIFTNGMLDLIKAEVKPRDKVYKMLELLEKRGPKAFDNFVFILRENYEWLADMLEDQYNKRLNNQGRSPSRSNQTAVQHKYHSYHDTVPHRTSSTPNLGNRNSRETTVPTQESVSASDYEKNKQQFFGDNTGQQSERAMTQTHGLDCTDNLTIDIPQSIDTKEPLKEKKYKDACISPIGIIESSRKKGNAMYSQEHTVRFANDNECISEADSYFDEIRTQATDTTAGAPRESHYKQDAQCEGFETDHYDENADAVDGFENVNIELDEDLPGEVYYELARRGSSCIPHYGDETFDEELSTPGCLGNRFHSDNECYVQENNITRSDIECEHSEALVQLTESIKALYQKLATVNSESGRSRSDEDIVESEDDIIIMMENEVDKLISRLQNSDDMKMILKCYEMFEERNRKHPLNMCIEGLIAEKKDVETRLNDKQKEIDRMVFDLWKHQQDMSNIRKLNQANADMTSEIENLKSSLRDCEIKRLAQVELKDTKIRELENKVKELISESKKPGASPRRGNGTIQRRTSNVQGQSPRRTTMTGLTDTRPAIMQASYGTSQQSPRNVTTATGFRKVNTTRR